MVFSLRNDRQSNCVVFQKARPNPYIQKVTNSPGVFIKKYWKLVVQGMFVAYSKNVVREFWKVWFLLPKYQGSKSKNYKKKRQKLDIGPPDFGKKNQHVQNTCTTFLEHDTNIYCTYFQPFLMKNLGEDVVFPIFQLK